MVDPITSGIEGGSMLPRLHPDRCVLLLIDFQERLFAAMPEAIRDAHVKHAEDLKYLADAMGIPVLVTEQYPKGLGTTLPGLEVAGPFEKLAMSAMVQEGFVDRLAAEGASQVIVAGMETHVCVCQTVRDLLKARYRVWVAADACLSRRKLDWEVSLRHMASEGAMVVTTEMILFGLLERAGTPLFKEVSRRIRG